MNRYLFIRYHALLHLLSMPTLALRSPRLRWWGGLRWGEIYWNERGTP